jgi:hypothetical protein
MIAVSVFGSIFEENFGARFMPTLSKQSRSPIQAKRNVRNISTELDTRTPIPVQGMPSPFLRRDFSAGFDSIEDCGVALARGMRQGFESWMRGTEQILAPARILKSAGPATQNHVFL